MLSLVLKKLAYVSGALGLYHRLRNARTLTVIMFHRVLSADDPRWASCDPDYTLDAELFANCLQFFRTHYHVVSVNEVLAARRGGRALPPRALLITFDDGWADNVDFALPRLRQAAVPGLMFVVADAVDRARPFYQEQIVGAWRRGALPVEMLARALRQHGVPVEAGPDRIDVLRSLIARVEALDPAARTAVLAPLEAALDDGQQHMIRSAQLQQLLAGGMAIGLHGKSHEPMTRATDLEAELSGARSALAARLPHAPLVTMSFPHGRFTEAIAQRAHEAGYELIFTSVPAVNRSSPRVGWLLARLGFETAAVVDRQGRFAPALLALYLFRRPVAAGS